MNPTAEPCVLEISRQNLVNMTVFGLQRVRIPCPHDLWINRKPVDNPVDKIVLTGLEFHAFHGAFNVEAELGGRFVIDLELQLNLSGINDRLEKTVSYAEVFETVKLEVTTKKYNLIETLAENIAMQVLLEHQGLELVLVRVHKPFAPIPGIFRDVAVEVIRTRT